MKSKRLVVIFSLVLVVISILSIPIALGEVKQVSTGWSGLSAVTGRFTSITGMAVTDITGCTTITKPGNYRLTNDIINSGATDCIFIKSSNVYFYGNYKLIDGIDKANTNGIRVDSGVAGVKLKNITINYVRVSDWHNGISFSNVHMSNNEPNDRNTSRIEKSITVYSNVNGIFLSQSDHISTIEIQALNNTNVGLGVYNSIYISNYNSRFYNNYYGIYLSNASASNFLGYTRVTDNFYGVYITNPINNKALDNSYITIDGGPPTSSHNEISNNKNTGLVIARVNGVRLAYNNIRDNKGTALSLSGVNNTDIAYNLISKDPNNQSSLPGTGSGMTLGYSNKNLISSNNISGFAVGMSLVNSSENKMNKTRILYNKNAGITLSNSKNNTIWDNLFNNTNNYIFYNNFPNTWNIPKTTATNIVNRPYMGGNYWGTPIATGFSDTCTDTNGDFICDSPYTLGSSNVDYLPLKK